MQAFQRGKLTFKPAKEQIAEYMDQHGLSREHAKRFYNEMKNDEIWVNDLYQVNIHRNTPNHSFGAEAEIDHLSIKRRDKQPIHDWRDLQEIKNLLMGPEREAVEVYPRESRRVDTANQYHLWVIPAGEMVGVGWHVRLVSGAEDAAKIGAVQREL
jgi:hypothetical protein